MFTFYQSSYVNLVSKFILNWERNWTTNILIYINFIAIGQQELTSAWQPIMLTDFTQEFSVFIISLSSLLGIQTLYWGAYSLLSPLMTKETRTSLGILYRHQEHTLPTRSRCTPTMDTLPIQEHTPPTRGRCPLLSRRPLPGVHAPMSPAATSPTFDLPLGRPLLNSFSAQRITQESKI